jgi:dCMP deaminase
MERLPWENYALLLAKTASIRSKDPWKKVGSCALRYDKSVAACGYNGEPRGISIDWSNRDERRKRVIHSEINTLAYCKPNEIWLLASTLLPCHTCMQSIAAYGVKRVVFEEIYQQDDLSLTLAGEFGIDLVQIKI